MHEHLECLDHRDRLAQDEVSGRHIGDWVPLRIPEIELALFSLVGAELGEFVHGQVIFPVLCHHEKLFLALVCHSVHDQLVEVCINRADCLLDTQLFVLFVHHFVTLMGIIDLVLNTTLHQESNQDWAVW